MTKRETLIEEIKKMPEPLLDELLDFIKFLQTRKEKGKYDTMIVSEPILRKDWSKPEEDAAWQDL